METTIGNMDYDYFTFLFLSVIFSTNHFLSHSILTPSAFRIVVKEGEEKEEKNPLFQLLSPLISSTCIRMLYETFAKLGLF